MMIERHSNGAYAAKEKGLVWRANLRHQSLQSFQSRLAISQADGKLLKFIFAARPLLAMIVSKRLLNLVVILLLGMIPAEAAIFTEINTNLIGGGFSSSVATDFDNDGKVDILTDGQNGFGGYTTIWRNLGGGSFSDFADLDLNFYGAYAGGIAVGDFYNNGKQDALITGIDIPPNGFSTNVTELWHNLGNGTFVLLTNSGLPAETGYAAAGDLNNDGKLDTILSGYTNANHTGIPFTQVWRNLGNGTFTRTNSGLDRNVSTLLLCDFDNDGYLDILKGGSLWLNLGNGAFTNVNSGLPANVVAVGDFDNDGYPDVIVANSNYEIWRNLGNGTFTNSNIVLPAVSGPSGLFPPVCAVGDFDNDGLLDIVLTTGNSFSDPTVQVWRNLGNGTFTNVHSITAGTQGSLIWGDFNNDSLLDFFMTGQSGTDQHGNPTFIAQIWQNNSGSPSNSPPTAPVTLTSQNLGSNGIKLLWSAATDDHTPVSGLNYNIRVGSFCGGVDIVSPEADPATGRRYVVQMGNAQERLFSLLTNLCGGTYHWSVQAIDTAFAGGPFASEATFVIPPAISGYSYATNGQFQVSFNALGGSSYTLQASTNLAQWCVITNVMPATNGPAQLTDTNIFSFPRRYYRLSCP